MKKTIIVIVVIITMAAATSTASAATDYDLAKAWAGKHCKGAKVERVITVAQGGYTGKVKGGKWRVKYPKKVKKGKTIKVYMVVKNGDVKAMVCMGKVK